MRRGFGILQALAIMLLLAGLLTIMLKYARIGVRHTAESYLREQTELFLQSSIEQALLEISDTNRSEKCWMESDDQNYTWDDGRGRVYRAHIEVERYYLVGGQDGECNGTSITTPESNGYVMLRIEANATQNGRPLIRLIRRSLQRP